MVKHIVMWKLHPEADGRSLAENREEMKVRLESLKDRIPEILALEVGINYNPSVDAYDIVLYSEFKDKAAQDAYQVHPAHVEARDFIQKVRSEKRVVDYEI